MSDMRHFECDGRQVNFFNRARNTYSGFAHDTEFYVDDKFINKATCTYMNRTWENYTYQSVMLKAIYKAMQTITDKIKQEFKAKNNYKAITAIRKIALDKEIESDEEYKFLTDVRTKIRGDIW